MFVAELLFTTPSATEPDPAHLVGPLGVVEVDLSPMSENICTEGNGA